MKTLKKINTGTILITYQDPKQKQLFSGLDSMLYQKTRQILHLHYFNKIDLYTEMR